MHLVTIQYTRESQGNVKKNDIKQGSSVQVTLAFIFIMFFLCHHSFFREASVETELSIPEIKISDVLSSAMITDVEDQENSKIAYLTGES